jgi:tetratricopeptide (TPR) repeat protein
MVRVRVRSSPGDDDAGLEEKTPSALAVNELRGTVEGTAVQARDIHGGVHVTVNPATTAPPVPAQLPPQHGIFAGRDPELQALDDLAATGHELVVINGVGGCGKTALAAHWAYRVSDQYPGGVLYADLRGHKPDDAADPGVVLASFLLALGVGPEFVPLTLNDRANLFRTITAGRRILALLDNAASAAQVRALLLGPSVSRSAVVVTTRWSLTGLAMNGAHFLGLGPLDDDASERILATMAGHDRATAEPRAIRDVARLCAGLPLAIRISGAHLTAHPRRTVSRLAAQLADEKLRLTRLSLVGDVSVSGAIEFSYRALPELAARCYRLFSLLFTADFGIGLASAVLGDDASAPLEILAGVSLLDEMLDDRYRFHDLVRLHARQQAETDSAMVQDAVTSRAVEWYLNEAASADRMLLPGRERLYSTSEGTDHSDPLGWLESELPGLAAAVQAAHDAGLHERAWQLCEALTGLFFHRKHFARWIETHETGLASAIACGDERAEVATRVRLGNAYLQLRQMESAVDQFRAALDVARRTGNRVGEASALEHLGLTRLAAGQPDEATASFARAGEIFRELGRPRGEMLMTRRLGEAHRDAARHDEAITCLRQAATQAADLGEPYHQMRSLTALGQTYAKFGHPELALATFGDAMVIAERVEARYEQARIHVSAARVELALGHRASARRHLTAAHTTYTELAAPEAEDAARLLTELP